MTNLVAANLLVEQFMVELQPLVTSIEENPFPTTMNNYGKYYELLSGFSEKGVLFLVGVALVRCNANSEGVISALKLCDSEAGDKLELVLEARKTMQ